jgi:hypothetical protein
MVRSFFSPAQPSNSVVHNKLPLEPLKDATWYMETTDDRHDQNDTVVHYQFREGGCKIILRLSLWSSATMPLFPVSRAADRALRADRGSVGTVFKSPSE